MGETFRSNTAVFNQCLGSLSSTLNVITMKRDIILAQWLTLMGTIKPSITQPQRKLSPIQPRSICTHSTPRIRVEMSTMFEPKQILSLSTIKYITGSWMTKADGGLIGSGRTSKTGIDLICIKTTVRCSPSQACSQGWPSISVTSQKIITVY